MSFTQKGETCLFVCSSRTGTIVTPPITGVLGTSVVVLTLSCKFNTSGKEVVNLPGTQLSWSSCLAENCHGRLVPPNTEIIWPAFFTVLFADVRYHSRVFAPAPYKYTEHTT